MNPIPLLCPCFALFLPCFLPILFTTNNMSSRVSPGPQSCLETLLLEPSVLSHKLAPPRSNSSQSNPIPVPLRPCLARQQELGGWNFVQSLTNTSYNHKEEVYVHPLVKPSSPILSPKSLEMCTESLGSETGSEISENRDEFSPLPPKKQGIGPIQRLKPSKKRSKNGDFPPPLSSISGLDNVQVRPHREGGRLVLKAVTVSSHNTLFQAERVGGRLRLCLVKDFSLKCDHDMAQNVEEEEEEEEERNEKVEEECGNDDNSENGDRGFNDNSEGCDGGFGGNSGKFGGEVEVGEFPRPRRCKEGGNENKGMCNWGPLWVAISY